MRPKPKTAATDQIKSVYPQNWALLYNKRVLLKEFDETTQLTDTETENLKSKIQQQMAFLEQQQHKKFDSSKNWSLMINPEFNDLRNEIMKRTKSVKIKRQSLHSV